MIIEFGIWWIQKISFFQIHKFNSQFVSPNFLELILRLIGQNDAKDMDVAQPIWLSGCPEKCLLSAKNANLVSLALTRPFVGQPDNNIG